MPKETRVQHIKTAAECYNITHRKSNAVITTLLPDGPMAGKSAVFLSNFKNLVKNNQADVVFFNPHGWPEDRINDLRRQLGTPDLQVLCIAQQDWARQHKDRRWEYVMREGNGSGYRSMCQWHSRRVLSVLYRMGYDWAIRMDTDSAFPEPVPYNLVEVMEKTGAVYGFRAMNTENPLFATALPEAARYWLTAENIQPAFILQHCSPPTMEGLSSKGWNHTIIFNNFFITRLSWWVQPQVRAWLIHLENMRGWYKHRWGDAPVHTMTLGMFLPEAQMLEFGFLYEHDVGSGKNTYGRDVFKTSFPHYSTAPPAAPSPSTLAANGTAG